MLAMRRQASLRTRATGWIRPGETHWRGRLASGATRQSPRGHLFWKFKLDVSEAAFERMEKEDVQDGNAAGTVHP